MIATLSLIPVAIVTSEQGSRNTGILEQWNVGTKTSSSH
jgi:hypothetical protein